MKRQVFVALTTIAFWTSCAWSQDSATQPPADRQRLKEALEAENSLAPETKKALLDALASIEESKTNASQAGAAATAAPVDARRPTWERVLERLSVYGDLRLRHESNFELDSQRDRHRERIRFRLGAAYSITDEFTVGARVSTGDPEDPKSPHVTLGSDFERFDFNLDRAYLSYKPEFTPGLSVTAGKFGHPFVTNPVYGELAWDADVQPEGAVAEYIWRGDGRIDSIEARVGEYVVLENSSTAEVLSTVAQLATRFSPLEQFDGLAALGYTFYTDPTPGGSQELIQDSAGNALVDRDGDGTVDDFLSDFGLLHSILALTYKGFRWPVTLAAEYFWNTRAETSKDQGLALGIAVGRKKQRGDWHCFYQWQLIQQDAVFSPFTQDDFLLATNHDSHVFGVNYQILDDLGVRAWTLVSQRDRTLAGPTVDSGSAQWRTRLDLNIRF